jgi:LPXTG-motif cell wall-anchored protein
MTERRRNRLRWLLVIVLLVVVTAVIAVLLLTSALIGSGVRPASGAQTATAILLLNSTAEAQIAASETADALVTAAQTPTASIKPEEKTPAFTATPTPTPLRTATSSAYETTTTVPVAGETEAVLPTSPEISVSDVQLTATELAMLLSTALHSTQEAVGGSPSLTSLPQGGALVTSTEQLILPFEQETQPAPSATPLVIAAANLLIRSDVSGEVIGDGTLKVYAPESARYPETARVELELHLDNLYITPTPNGGQGTPVPRSTTVATSGGTTPTPYLPIITDQGVPVYQRMGATLLCSEQSFRGCDTGRDQSQAKIISSQTTTWSWIISPHETVSGSQDLQLEVWLVERNLDGKLEYLDLPGTPYHLSIQVNPATGSSAPLIIAIAAVVVLAGGSFMQWRKRRTPPRWQHLGAQGAPLVFISYRRGSSWGQARSIEQSLRERGANVFIDIDDINEGRFAETIEKAIQDCDYVVAVLAPGTLDSPWVRREIASALAANKIIVPLLVDGFTLDEQNIPPEIKDVASHNAITVLPEFYEEAMNRLAKRFLRLGNKGGSEA